MQNCAIIACMVYVRVCCVERCQITNEIENIKIDTAVAADSPWDLTFNTNYLLLSSGLFKETPDQDNLHLPNDPKSCSVSD